MAVIKADVPDPIKREFKEIAKSKCKTEYACVREAIKNYINATKAPR